MEKRRVFPLISSSFMVGLCACGAHNAVPSSPGMTLNVAPNASDALTAKPSKVAFALGAPKPVSVTLTDGSGVGNVFTVRVGDPTQLGVSMPKPTSETTAKTKFYPISRGLHGGNTTVTIADAAGHSVKVAVTQQLCGRPDNLHGADLIYPPKRAKNVATGIGALYFAVYTAYSAPGNGSVHLHLIVGKHGTLEGSTLAKAAPPPGSVVPAPPPWPIMVTTMRGRVPALPAARRIGTQVYDDNCQGAYLSGTFHTT